MYERFLEGWDIIWSVAAALGGMVLAVVAFFLLMYAFGWVYTLAVGLYGLAKDKIEERKAFKSNFIRG